MKARALVEIITYVENCVEDEVFYFKFSVLHQMFENRLKNLGFDKGTNRTLIKNSLHIFHRHKSKVWKSTQKPDLRTL